MSLSVMYNDYMSEKKVHFEVQAALSEIYGLAKEWLKDQMKVTPQPTPEARKTP